MVDTTVLMWSAFAVIITFMLIIDLGVLNRKSHTPSMKEATIWSIVWIAVSLLFNLGIYLFSGPAKAMEFLAGYLIEKSLSVDNLFVFIIIFEYFKVRTEHQPKILKWGILGAILMRAALIGAGVALIHQFHWMTYVFGGLLLFTVAKMMFLHGDTFNPGDNLLVRMFRRIIPITSQYHGDHFIIRRFGAIIATPLLLVVIVVESSDLIFALDSIPAIFAVSTDPFIVYSSNIFAILGLRALYFVLAGMARHFQYLKPGIILVLLFVAIKMLIIEFYKIPIFVSLAVVGGILGISIIASVILRRRSERAQKEERPLLVAAKPKFDLNANNDKEQKKQPRLEEEVAAE